MNQTMLKRDEQRLFIKIATLYHTGRQKQSDIAKQLDLSQSFVSRVLSRCVNEGIVKISVVQLANVYLNLESAIQNKYDIAQAIVVDVDEDAEDDKIISAIGSATAHYLQTTLHGNELVGVSAWSNTIRSMVEQLHPLNIKTNGVVQLLGGVGVNGNVQATMLTYSLAKLLNCPSYLLPSQSIEHTVDYRLNLMRTDEVGKVVDMFKDVTLALVGIGMLEPSVLLKNSGNYYQQDMLAKLARRGAVGDICLHYFNKQGKPVLTKDEDPVIGMDLDLLKRCPRVVALAGGVDKAQAIKGALTGGYIDVLVIDKNTAKLLV